MTVTVEPDAWFHANAAITSSSACVSVAVVPPDSELPDPDVPAVWSAGDAADPENSHSAPPTDCALLVVAVTVLPVVMLLASSDQAIATVWLVPFACDLPIAHVLPASSDAPSVVAPAAPKIRTARFPAATVPVGTNGCDVAVAVS